jgi:hypothetical protein
MRRRHPDLIVPIRDRRQRKRYLTLKNFGIAMGVFVVLFIAITIRSEMRGNGPSNYGRLVERELPPVAHEQKPVEVVRETPTVDVEQTHADPMLTAPMAREQWLHAQTETAAVPVPIAPRVAASVVSGETEVAIVGGPEGVQIVQKERRRPTLSGGFGRKN